MAFELLTLTRELETGITDIDDQHRVLVKRINQFHQAYETNKPDDIKIAIDALIDYTAKHFTYEEKMLEEADYFMTEAHKKVHDTFVAKMQDLQSRYNRNDLSACEDLVTLLDGWLFRHIRMHDKGYVDHVKRAGIR